MTMKSVMKIKPFHIDQRGSMAHLLPKETPITSALLIESKKGAVRGNHYHKKDTHYVYLLWGKYEYIGRGLQKNAKNKVIIIKPGELVITQPKHAHAMRFLEDSLWIVLTTERRNKKQYEKDTVRMIID